MDKNKIIVVIFDDCLSIQWNKYAVKHNKKLDYDVSFIKNILPDYTDNYVEYVQNDDQCISIYENNKSILYDILFDITAITDCEVI